MAIVKPATIPDWDTDGSNRTEPSSGKIIQGWDVEDKPASSFFNYSFHYTGSFYSWLNERASDGLPGAGIDEEHFWVHPPVYTVAPGLLSLLANQPLSAGAGGDINLFGGPAKTSGVGGDLTVRGGNAAGANQDGGSVVVAAGRPTGTGKSDLVFKAAPNGASGAGVNTPVEVLRLDGSLKRMVCEQRLVLEGNASQACGRIPDAAAIPSSPVTGEVAKAANSPCLVYWDGSEWRVMDRVLYSEAAPESHVLADTDTGNFGTWLTFPANSLQVGSIFRVHSFGRMSKTDGSVFFRLKLGGTTLHEGEAIISYNADAFRQYVCDFMVAVTGVTGGNLNLRVFGRVVPPQVGYYFGLDDLSTSLAQASAHALQIEFEAEITGVPTTTTLTQYMGRAELLAWG